jgi:hypothetical protein
MRAAGLCALRPPHPSRQAFKECHELSLAHRGNEVKINAGICEGAAKTHDQGKFLGPQVIAMLGERGFQVCVRFFSKGGIAHGLLGKALQHLDSHRSFFFLNHVNAIPRPVMLWSERRLYMRRRGAVTVRLPMRGQ